MNRPDISRLRKNRNIFLKIGLLASLCMVVFAFNYTVYEYENVNYETGTIEKDIFEPIVRTPRESKPKFVPPVLKPTDNIIPEDHEFVEDPLPEPIDTELKIDTQMVHQPALPIFVKKPKPSVDLQPKTIVETEPPIWTVVEDMPRFPGCEAKGFSKEEKAACANEALLKYIYSKIKYPEIASKNGIEGTVVLDFVVEKTGEITDIQIRKEIGGGCGKEVVRVVKGMPEWIPGKQRNNEVRVRFTLPVKFTLQ